MAKDEKKKCGSKTAAKKPIVAKVKALPKIPTAGDAVERMTAMLEVLSSPSAQHALEDDAWREALSKALEASVEQIGTYVAAGKFPALLPMATFLPLHVRLMKHLKEKGSEPTQEEFEEYMNQSLDELLMEDVDVMQSVFEDFLESADEKTTSKGTMKMVDGALSLLDLGASEPLISAMMVAAVEGQGVTFLECENLPEFDDDELHITEDLLVRWGKALQEGELPGMALRTCRLIETAGFPIRPEVQKMIDALVEEGAEEPQDGGGCGCCGGGECEECEEEEPRH